MKTLNQTEIISISGAMAVQMGDINLSTGSVSAVTLETPVWSLFPVPQNNMQVQGQGIHIGGATFNW